MKRIGLLALALVLALGALGVGYAMWSDEVVVEGTVDTGTVRIGIVKAVATLDQTKDVATVDITFEDPLGPWDCPIPREAQDYAYDRVVVTIDDAFPCLWVDIEFYVGNVGTIPIHIVGLEMSDPTGELTVVWVVPPGGAGDPNGYFYRTGGDPVEDRVITFWIINQNIGAQLHGCDPKKADLILHVEQPAEQDHEYRFEFKVIAQQWAK